MAFLLLRAFFVRGSSSFVPLDPVYQLFQVEVTVKRVSQTHLAGWAERDETCLGQLQKLYCRKSREFVASAPSFCCQNLSSPVRHQSTKKREHEGNHDVATRTLIMVLNNILVLGLCVIVRIRKPLVCDAEFRYEDAEDDNRERCRGFH